MIRTGRTYIGIKSYKFSLCIKVKFYANLILLYNGKILCQGFLAVYMANFYAGQAGIKCPNDIRQR